MDSNTLLDGRLKIRHLVLAIAIFDHGSIVRAAQHLHVTQPVVTRALKELEELLGVELFDRGPKGVKPTVYAEAFLEHARGVLAHLRQASQHVAELSNATSGSVTVGIHLAGANLLLPRAIALLKSRSPGVVVLVREGMPDRLATDLAAGDVDLVVGRQGQINPAVPLQQIRLYEEPFRIVARRNHPALSLVEPKLADLDAFPWVLPLGQTSLRGELLELFQRHGLAFPKNWIECTAPLTVRTFVAETNYLAVLPETLALAEPQLAVLATPLTGVSQTIVASHAADFPPSPSTFLMLDSLRHIGAQMVGSFPLQENRAMEPKTR